MKRRCLLCIAVLLEPCVHILGFLTGVQIPHPEGLGQVAMNYIANVE